MTAHPLNDDDILQMVHAAIDEHNALAAVPLAKTPQTPLFGGTGTLDSLSLVNLIIGLEQQVLDRTGRALALAEDRAFSQTRSPFRDIASLTAYLRERLSETPS